MSSELSPSTTPASDRVTQPADLASSEVSLSTLQSASRDLFQNHSTNETVTSDLPERNTFDVETSQRRSSLDQNSSFSMEGTASFRDGSTSLPGDDGMRKLRSQIHLIRDMALSSEEKAKRMHALMVADYEALKLGNNKDSPSSSIEDTNPARPVKQASTSRTSLAPQPEEDEDLALVLPEDREPTYHPETFNESRIMDAQDTSDVDENEPILGCPHYMRNVKIQCRDCKKWYTCRHCHNLAESHPINRRGIRNMLCMLCGHPQRAAEYCENCQELTAAYYCNICKLWENDTGKSIYHCEDCGICRRGEGLGRDFVHCKKCNVCISIGWIDTHKCVERATECDCPICSLWLFTSSEAVVSMQCGHYIHRQCYDEYMKQSYKCPICNKSAVNMELQWRKLDHAILSQPMPSQFSETKVLITCNDCAARTCSNYHWLGNKCTVCDSYNTNKIKLINTPSDEEIEAVANSNEAMTMREIGRSINEIGDASSTIPLEPNGRSESVVDIDAIPGFQHEQQHSTNATDTDNHNADAVTGEYHSTTGPNPLNFQPRSAVTDDELVESQNLIPGTIDRNHSTSNQPATNSNSIQTREEPNRNTQRVNDDNNISQQTNEEDEDGHDNDNYDDDDDDEVGFWGAGISPSSWSLPLSISPMSGWTSPSFFATRTASTQLERSQEPDLEVIEDNDDSDWSTDESNEGETVDLEEDNDIDEIELLGHR